MKKILVLLLTLSVSFSCYSRLLKKHIPDKLVVFTFDDATASQYSVVAPLLKKYGFGATFFVCEMPPNFKDSSKYMNWRQIKELDKMGFEVANHTRTHPAVSRLTREQFIEELDYIEDKCDSLDIAKPTSFAYPAYDLSRSVIDILAEKGYKFARKGGNRGYDPLIDHPLLVPSWAMTAGNKTQIMEAFDEARNGLVVVLTIHGVPDVEHPWVNTPPELFREYLKYLYDHQYKVIALRDLNRYINVKKAIKSIVPDINKKSKN
ncbi:MAG: polysaccharide deacetylase family protein [Bacteroidia bacterium]|nr:polysaccharide deacetylase family protein [Bacteroidia bacterium]